VRPLGDEQHEQPRLEPRGEPGGLTQHLASTGSLPAMDSTTRRTSSSSPFRRSGSRATACCTNAGNGSYDA
jgi:hypothetical protein